jgi:predicted metal-dependent hydrolase
VRVAAPLAVSDDAIRLAVIGKIAWITRQWEKFNIQPRQTDREAISGESHYVFGQRYRLNLITTTDRPQVVLRGKTKMDLHVLTRATKADRLAVLNRWYREQLRSAASTMLERWQDAIGVSLAFWGVKRMKTKWGSCNHQTKRVWLNLELAKKPLACIEYIVVHELVHLLEPTHGDRFVALMDEHLPDWRQRRDLLNSTPLANETWTY